MMSDGQLREKVLGWRQTTADGPQPETAMWERWVPGGFWELVGSVGEATPDFAHDIAATMKLARAACKKWDLAYSVGQVQHGRGHLFSFATFRNVTPGGPTGSAECQPDAEALALRIAVVNVVEAHEPKGDSDGEA